MTATGGVTATQLPSVRRVVLDHTAVYKDVSFVDCPCGAVNLTLSEHAEHVAAEVDRALKALLDPIRGLVGEWRAYGTAVPPGAGSPYLAGYNAALVAQSTTLLALLGEPVL